MKQILCPVIASSYCSALITHLTLQCLYITPMFCAFIIQTNPHVVNVNTQGRYNSVII